MKSLLLAAIVAASFTVSSAQCGVEPVKPVPPAGCKDMQAMCACDANGENCRWVWVCVPDQKVRKMDFLPKLTLDSF